MAANANTKLYNYEPLPHEASIRLIKLSSAQHLDEPLQCEITEATISTDSYHKSLSEQYNMFKFKPKSARLASGEAVEYAALSYVWGVPEFVKTISCAGTTVIPITETLDFALRRLRAANACYVWVDAISINQADMAERISQVKFMGSIFGQAECVHVWLGEDDAETIGSEVFESLRQTDLGWDWRNFHKRILDLGQLLQRSFWSRRWVIQEVMLARELVFHWGANSMDGRQFFRRLAILIGASVNAATIGFHEAVLVILNMRLLDGTRHDDSSIMDGFPNGTPIAMFHAFTGYQCKEENDIVYSLLGLLERARPLTSAPSFARLLQSANYKASAEETYMALARYHLTFITKKPNCVEEMLQCALRTHFVPWADTTTLETLNPNGWPSWLPDWRKDSIYPPSDSLVIIANISDETEWSHGFYEIERGFTGSSAINEASKCLSIAVYRSEDITWVEAFDDESIWDDERCNEQLSKGPSRKFLTTSRAECFGHPSVRLGDFLVFVGRKSGVFTPFVFRPRVTTHDLNEVSQAVLVGDCKFVDDLHVMEYLEVAPRLSRLDVY